MPHKSLAHLKMKLPLVCKTNSITAGLRKPPFQEPGSGKLSFSSSFDGILEISLHFPALWVELSSPTVAISALKVWNPKENSAITTVTVDSPLLITWHYCFSPPECQKLWRFDSRHNSQHYVSFWITHNPVMTNFFCVVMSFCALAVHDFSCHCLTFFHHDRSG